MRAARRAVVEAAAPARRWGLVLGTLGRQARSLTGSAPGYFLSYPAATCSGTCQTRSGPHALLCRVLFMCLCRRWHTRLSVSAFNGLQGNPRILEHLRSVVERRGLQYTLVLLSEVGLFQESPQHGSAQSMYTRVMLCVGDQPAAGVSEGLFMSDHSRKFAT